MDQPTGNPDIQRLTHVALHRMIEDTIHDYHLSHRSPVTGQIIPARSETAPLDHVLVTLSPDLMLACARKEFIMPRSMGEFDVRISEKPSLAHLYYPCYLVTVHGVYYKNGKARKSRGRVTLERSLTDEEKELAAQAWQRKDRDWWR